MILDKLKTYKTNSGKSWYKIAQELGLPAQTIYYWSSKGVRPLRVYQDKIAEYLTAVDNLNNFFEKVKKIKE